jgi:hypothetical protein
MNGIRWVRLVACTEEKINAYRISVRSPEGKRPRERHRRRCENNIKMDFRGILWEGMEWINLT